MKFILSIFILNILISCASSPLGRKQLLILSDTQMNSMGVTAFDQIKSKTPIETKRETVNYVNCVANAIIETMTDQSIKWEVVVFKEDKTVNAFALPGGKIGVYTGILKVANTQHQLGAILGHEVGHVIAQHGNERVSEAFLTESALSLIDNLAEKGKYHGALMGLLGLGANVGIMLPHSRTQESEADLIGLKLMAQAGFDPKESITLWENMAKVGGKGTPEFLSTHPSDETRIQNLSEHLQDVIQSPKNPSCTRN